MNPPNCFVCFVNHEYLTGKKNGVNFSQVKLLVGEKYWSPLKN